MMDIGIEGFGMNGLLIGCGMKVLGMCLTLWHEIGFGMLA